MATEEERRAEEQDIRFFALDSALSHMRTAYNCEGIGSEREKRQLEMAKVSALISIADSLKEIQDILAVWER